GAHESADERAGPAVEEIGGPGVLTGGVIERHADEEVAAARSQREPEIVVPRDGRVRDRERHRVRLRGRRPRADQERHAEPPRRPPAHDVTLAKGGGTAQGPSRCAGWTDLVLLGLLE